MGVFDPHIQEIEQNKNKKMEKAQKIRGKKWYMCLTFMLI